MVVPFAGISENHVISSMFAYIIIIISRKSQISQEVIGQSIGQISTIKLQAKELYMSTESIWDILKYSP